MYDADHSKGSDGTFDSVCHLQRAISYWQVVSRTRAYLGTGDNSFQKGCVLLWESSTIINI